MAGGWLGWQAGTGALVGIRVLCWYPCSAYYVAELFKLALSQLTMPHHVSRGKAPGSHHAVGMLGTRAPENLVSLRKSRNSSRARSGNMGMLPLGVTLRGTGTHLPAPVALSRVLQQAETVSCIQSRLPSSKPSALMTESLHVHLQLLWIKF